MNDVKIILGNFYPIAQEVGKLLGRKICDAIDWAIPFDSSENESSKLNVKSKNNHEHGKH